MAIMEFPTEEVKSALETEHEITGNPEVDKDLCVLRLTDKVNVGFTKEKVRMYYENAVECGEDTVLIYYEPVKMEDL